MSTVSDRARLELHQCAETTWGQEAADTLMSYLPPVGYADVATKSDIDTLRAQAQADNAVLRAEMEAMEARLLARMQEQFTEVHEAIAHVHETMAGQARWFVMALSGTVIAVSALPQVVERLLP